MGLKEQLIVEILKFSKNTVPLLVLYLKTFEIVLIKRSNCSPLTWLFCKFFFVK